METAAITACAALVERGDPDRFLAAMAAPVAARGALFTLAAFNLELARIPWVTRETVLAQMRLQFWRDVVAGEDPAPHEVAGPLRALLAGTDLTPAPLLAMIDAREVELGTSRPFADTEALWRYLSGTGGALMVAMVQALGGAGDASGHDAAEAIGTAQGLANYLAAVPALTVAGRHPLPDQTAAAVADLAAEGLRRFDQARRRRPTLPRAALLGAWRTRSLLAQALAGPGAVLTSGLPQSEFRRRGSLLWRALTGP